MTAISVVMGVYNGADTLAATLDSILAQTEDDFECIVVDDGSTDETPSILAGYAARDPRISVITQQNAGLTRALIAGCTWARGAYIARHDAGDLSHRARLARQKSIFDSDGQVVLVSCWTEFVGPEGERLYDARGVATSPIDMLDFGLPGGVVEGPTHHGSVMFRRDAYERAGGYRAAFYFGQDWDLWYRLAALGKFQKIAGTLYTARVTPESISGRARRAQEKLAVLSLAAARARARGESDEDLLAAAARVRPSPWPKLCSRARGLYFIGEALRRNGDRRARRYLRLAIAACPFDVRAWIRYVQSLFTVSARP